MTPFIKLFDSNAIESLNWHNNKIKSFLEPLIKNGTTHFIDNVKAEILALQIDELIIPIVVSQGTYTNSHVCSPYSQYISYAKEELALITNPALRKLAEKTLGLLGKVLQGGEVESVVYINHWLFSSDLYPEGLHNKVEAIVDFLKTRYPNHAISFHSLNPITNTALIDSIRQIGFQFIVSKQVFITNAKNEKIFSTRILKSDLKLSREKPHEIVEEMTQDDLAEVLKLYRLHYLTNHSQLNPQYNEKFIELAFQSGALKFKILKIGGKIRGTAGYFTCEGVMQSPFFGYDKQAEDHALVYRLLSTALLLEARKQQVVFHQGSGAAFYKTIRRAQSCIDTMAVYTRHLSLKKRVAWSTLRTFMNTFAPRYLKKY